MTKRRRLVPEIIAGACLAGLDELTETNKTWRHYRRRGAGCGAERLVAAPAGALTALGALPFSARARGAKCHRRENRASACAVVAGRRALCVKSLTINRRQADRIGESWPAAWRRRRRCLPEASMKMSKSARRRPIDDGACHRGRQYREPESRAETLPASPRNRRHDNCVTAMLRF